MLKLYGHWFSHDEIAEALKKKGYTVVTLEVSTHPRDYPLYKTYAFKDKEKPDITDTLQSAALKEFHKKPALV